MFNYNVNLSHTTVITTLHFLWLFLLNDLFSVHLCTSLLICMQKKISFH